MNFAENQRASAPALARISAVVVLHIALGYALLNGLAHQIVEVLKEPLDVSIIEEVKPQPPKALPPPPKVVEPPPPYVPPPEVHVEAPTPVENTITVTTPEPPPPAPVQVVAPPTVNVAVACANHVEVRRGVVYPPQAERMGLNGDVVVDFVLSADGRVTDVAVAKTTNTLFNNAATTAVAKLHCSGQGHDVRVRVPFSFRVDR